MIVGSSIARHAQLRPTELALVFEREAMTWENLEILLRRAAAVIETRSPSGQSVALLLPNVPALAIFFLAAVRLGREAQILEPQWHLDETQRVLALLNPALLISTEPLDGAHSCIVLPETALDFAGLSNFLGSSGTLDAWPHVDPDASFYVGFTSGSTGLPKGYRRSHRSWIASFEAAQQEFAFGARDVFVAPGALTHSLNLFTLACAMHEGALCLFFRKFKPNRILEWSRKYRATVLLAVPSQLEMIANYATNRDQAAVDSLHWLISSGSKWSRRDNPILRRIFHAAVFAEFYGASETSFIAVARDGDAAPADSVGRAFAGVEIRILGPDEQILPAGQVGRIFAFSQMLFKEYVFSPGYHQYISRNAIAPGDIGYLDADGFLFLTGRENRMIVTSGMNLYPEEVERVLEQCDGIEHAALIAAPDETRGEKLLAIVKTKSSARPTSRVIIAFARQRLPLFKTPRVYGVVSRWPFTPSGKTDFEELKRQWSAGLVRRLE